MNNINMNRDIPRAIRKNENSFKPIRKNEDEKENFNMGGLVLEYLAKKKAESKSKERQFGKDITNLILNNAHKNNSENSSENHNLMIFPAMKKIQTNAVNLVNLNERANSKKSVEKNKFSNSNSVSDLNHKNNSKIIASVKIDAKKFNGNSLKEIKLNNSNSSGNNVSKFNDTDRHKKVYSLERKPKNSSLDLKPVSSVKNLIKIPTHKPNNISLKYTFSTNNIHSLVLRNKIPSLSKNDINNLIQEEKTIKESITKDNENKENVDVNQIDRDCLSIPTGSTLESTSTENLNLKNVMNKHLQQFLNKKEPRDFSNPIKSERVHNSNLDEIKPKRIEIQKSKLDNNLINEKIKLKIGEIKEEDPSVSIKSKNLPQKIINLNNFTKPEIKEDIANSINDKPTICIEDIYLSLKEEEKMIYKSYNLEYMQIQTDVNEQMRGILIDWLAEVNLKFKLREETFFLTVNIVDRYLSKNVINRSKLQLLGVAAMFVACKFEEIYTPHIKDFVYITDNAYPYHEILLMEVKILKTLSYDILIATPLQFFELISKHFNLSKKEYYFGIYLLESFLIDYKSVKYSPSLMACTTGYIVMKFFKYKNYQQIYSGIFSPNMVQLKDCAKKICFLVDNLGNSNLNSLKKKFYRKEYLQVSSLNFS